MNFEEAHTTAHDFSVVTLFYLTKNRLFPKKKNYGTKSKNIKMYLSLSIIKSLEKKLIGDSVNLQQICVSKTLFVFFLKHSPTFQR